MFTEAAYSARKYATKTRRVLVTGAQGSIGGQIVPLLRRTSIVYETDVLQDDRWLDVTDGEQVRRWVAAVRPTHILHLAAAKHAPEGETSPEETFRTNTIGTANIVAAAGQAKVVLASTCKAADPETVYGASKLIAERMVLNAKGVVLRFYNVKETQGNVFRLWEQLPETEELPVMDCWRYFISTDDVSKLTLASLDFPTGRYAVDPGERVHMGAIVATEHPGRKIKWMPRRRGDRQVEPLCADSEKAERMPGTPFLRIRGYHDPA